MRVLRGHKGPVLCVASSPDGRTLASGGWDESVALWDVPTGRRIAMFDALLNPVTALRFSPDGRELAVGAGGLRVLDVPAGPLRPADRTTLMVHSLAYSPGGRWLADDSGVRAIRLWDAPGRRFDRWLSVANGELRDVGFPEDDLAITGWNLGGRGRLRWWDLRAHQRGELRGELASAVGVVAASPAGGWAAAGANDGSVAVWDVRRDTWQRTRGGHAAEVLALAFTPDGRALLSAGLDGEIQVWDVASGRRERCLNWGVGTVRSLAVAPDGMTAVAAGFDGSLVVWDLD